MILVFLATRTATVALQEYQWFANPIKKKTPLFAILPASTVQMELVQFVGVTALPELHHVALSSVWLTLMIALMISSK